MALGYARALALMAGRCLVGDRVAISEGAELCYFRRGRDRGRDVDIDVVVREAGDDDIGKGNKEG